eukprot:999997-Rhodomonas_salina.1
MGAGRNAVVPQHHGTGPALGLHGGGLGGEMPERVDGQGCGGRAGPGPRAAHHRGLSHAGLVRVPRDPHLQASEQAHLPGLQEERRGAPSLSLHRRLELRAAARSARRDRAARLPPDGMGAVRGQRRARAEFERKLPACGPGAAGDGGGCDAVLNLAARPRAAAAVLHRRAARGAGVAGRGAAGGGGAARRGAHRAGGCRAGRGRPLPSVGQRQVRAPACARAVAALLLRRRPRALPGAAGVAADGQPAPRRPSNAGPHAERRLPL